MFRFLLLALISGVWCLAQAPELEQAWKLAASGKREAAVDLLRTVIAQHPANADARLLLGSLLTEASQRDEAISQLTKAVHLRPHSSDAQNALGEAFLTFNEFPAARHPLEEAVSLNPKSGVAQLNLARVLLEAKEYKAAGEHLDRAISLLGRDEDAATAHYLRAKAFTAEGENQPAAKQLEVAVAIRPGFPEAWSDLGDARRALLDSAGAIAALRRAVQLAPEDAVAQYRLGAAYLSQHQPAQAVEPLREADRINPNDQSTLNALQRALRLTGQTEAADAVKQRLAAMLGQSDVTAQNELIAIQRNNEGAQLQSAGDLRGALQKYGEAVKLSPNTVAMRVNYAVAMLRLGEWTEGLNQLHQSLLMDPANAKIKAALRDAIAQAPPGSVPHWPEQDF
jgi:tetratricopeptide (TPR) repeat protein